MSLLCLMGRWVTKYKKNVAEKCKILVQKSGVSMVGTESVSGQDMPCECVCEYRHSHRTHYSTLLCMANMSNKYPIGSNIQYINLCQIKP